jgi:opacity protein-like surface antigen
MKRHLLFLAAAGLFFFSLTMPSFAQDSPKRFSLILSGGIGTMTGGDISKVMDGRNALLGDFGSALDFAVTETLESTAWGPGFEAEFLFRPARNFGLSLGTGYLRKTEDTRGAAELTGKAAISLDWIACYHLIPLKLSGYYFFPVGSKITAYAKAGFGYYFGRISYTIRTEETLLGVTPWEQSDGEARDSGFGLHGGLGLEYPLSPAFAFFVEAAGQYLQLKDWSVDNVASNAWGSESQKGSFWYAEEFNEELGSYYATFELSEVRPSDPNLRNVRQAAFGFSGFCLKAGLKISF